MKLKHLLILCTLLALTALAIFLRPKDDDGKRDEAVDKNVFPGLKTEDVNAIVMNGGKEEVTLEVKDGKWTVKGRDGFSANQDNITKLVTKAATMKVFDVKPDISEKYLSHFKLQPPGSGGKDDETGTHVMLKKMDGTAVASFMIGKNVGGSSGNIFSNARSQYIKPESIKDKVYVIQEAFDYFMNSITNKEWLDKATFFKAEKPKSITVTGNTPEESWTLAREKEGTDANEIKLTDAKPGEEFDGNKGSNSFNALASPSFNDVATSADKEKASLDKPQRTAVIETFDGFKYTVKVGKQVEKEVDPNAGASEEFYASIEVEANLVEKMPEPAPSPDDAKKTEEEKKKAREDAEKAFQAALATQKEKFAKEKSLSGKTFIVAKFVVDPILKNRKDFMKEKPAETPPPSSISAPPVAAPSPPTPPPPAPKREPISAVTPPVSIDTSKAPKGPLPVEAKPKEEIKLPPDAPAAQEPKQSKPKDKKGSK